VKDVKIFKVDIGGDFPKQFRRLARKKKFGTLPDQIDEIIENFEKGNFTGDFDGEEILRTEGPTPYSIYKLRMPNPDADAGKSNGYRLIYLIVSGDNLVVLLAIYYKKEIAAVSDNYIKDLADGYFLSLLPEEDNATWDEDIAIKTGREDFTRGEYTKFNDIEWDS
jgi:mRNA-degrading endonuclease RelE of RelBE toxin-antitoxin system